MDAYRMVIYPAVFLTLLQLIFSAFPDNTSNIDNKITIITNSTFPEPQSTWYGQTDLIGWFVATGSNILDRLVAGFALIGYYLFPFSTVANQIPTAILSSLLVLFGFLYVMLAIGLYKIISPFVGK